MQFLEFVGILLVELHPVLLLSWQSCDNLTTSCILLLQVCVKQSDMATGLHCVHTSIGSVCTLSGTKSETILKQYRTCALWYYSIAPYGCMKLSSWPVIIMLVIVVNNLQP